MLNGVGKDFAGAVACGRHERGRLRATRQARRVHGALDRDLRRLARRLRVSGRSAFGVPAPSINAAYGAGGPTTTEHLVRWLWFLGLALAVGALGFRLICLRGLDVPLALERRIAVAAGLGAVVSLQAGIAAFSLRAEDALQLPFGRFLYGDLSPMAATRFGEAFVVMTLGFAFVLALVYLSWLLDRVDFLVPAFVLCVGLLAGLSLSGHDAVDAGSSWMTETADWVHIAAASLWIGGLATMAVLRLAGRAGACGARRSPASRGSRRCSSHSSCRRARTSAIVRLPHLSDLWSRGYGQVLLVKLALVSVALAVGRVPQLRRAAGARARRRRFPDADRPQSRRREPGRDGGAARGRGARRLEAAGTSPVAQPRPGGRRSVTAVGDTAAWS